MRTAKAGSISRTGLTSGKASIGLARYVEDLGTRLKDAHILEIGCGFGLTGIVACRMGAKVVFTDVEPDALRFAHHNAEQNDVKAKADFIQMDWNTPCFNSKFRYILAADVIYEEHHWGTDREAASGVSRPQWYRPLFRTESKERHRVFQTA